MHTFSYMKYRKLYFHSLNLHSCVHTGYIVQSLSHVWLLGLRPHGLQHSRLPCSLPSYRACSNSCPLNQWCHPTISSSEMKHSPEVGFHPISGASAGCFHGWTVVGLNWLGWLLFIKAPCKSVLSGLIWQGPQSLGHTIDSVLTLWPRWSWKSHPASTSSGARVPRSSLFPESAAS